MYLLNNGKTSTLALSSWERNLPFVCQLEPQLQVRFLNRGKKVIFAKAKQMHLFCSFSYALSKSSNTVNYDYSLYILILN